MTDPKPEKIIVIAPYLSLAYQWAQDHGFRRNQVIYIGSSRDIYQIRGTRGIPHVCVDGPNWAGVHGIGEIFDVLQHSESPEYREVG